MSKLKWAASDLEVAFTKSMLTAAEAMANDYMEPVVVLLRNNQPRYLLASRVSQPVLDSQCVEVVNPRAADKYFCPLCGKTT